MTQAQSAGSEVRSVMSVSLPRIGTTGQARRARRTSSRRTRPSGEGYQLPLPEPDGPVLPTDSVTCFTPASHSILPLQRVVGPCLAALTTLGGWRELLRSAPRSRSFPLFLRADPPDGLTRNAESHGPRRFAFVAFSPEFPRSWSRRPRSPVRARSFGVRVRPGGFRSGRRNLAAKLSDSLVDDPRRVTNSVPLAVAECSVPYPTSSAVPVASVRTRAG
jgi:hypothetical protein